MAVRRSSPSCATPGARSRRRRWRCCARRRPATPRCSGSRSATLRRRRPSVGADRPAELERRSGWTIQPEGACRAEVCVPLRSPFDVRDLAERLGMALVHDEEHGLWALGPESGPRALASAELPDIVLPDRHGRDFALRSLRGTKVFMIAWASW